MIQTGHDQQRSLEEVRTMRRYTYARLGVGLVMPGVFVVPHSLPVAERISEIHRAPFFMTAPRATPLPPVHRAYRTPR